MSVVVKENYDVNRFISKKYVRLYNVVLNRIELADIRVFDFRFVNKCDLRIKRDFVKFGKRNFVAECGGIYLDSVKIY